MGFFLGNDTHKPARISWDGTNVAVYEYGDLDFGAVNKLYLRGASISPELVDGTEAKTGSVKDEYLNAYSHNYNLVKIFNKIWIREDYQATNIILDNGYYMTNNDYRNLGGNIYYKLSLAFDSHFPPSGWKIASLDNFKAIHDKLAANGINSIGAAFSSWGCLGFECRYNGHIFDPILKPEKDNVVYLTSDAYNVHFNTLGAFSWYGPFKKDEWGIGMFYPVRLVKI